MSDYSKSLSSALEGKTVAFSVVCVPYCLIYSGVIASAPKSLRDEKFVALDTTVLWLHTAFDITSAHLPFFSASRHFLIT
jgi:hypothetical protein